jgi:chromosome segregation ATPase
MREVRANLANFENSISEIADDENKLYRERERLLRSYEGKRTELQTIENNMGFFNSKSKAGDSMLREMQRKIQHIKEDIATLEKKIGVIDSKL